MKRVRTASPARQAVGKSTTTTVAYPNRSHMSTLNPHYDLVGELLLALNDPRLEANIRAYVWVLVDSTLRELTDLRTGQCSQQPLAREAV